MSKLVTSSDYGTAHCVVYALDDCLTIVFRATKLQFHLTNCLLNVYTVQLHES